MHFGEACFHAKITDGQLVIARSAAERADAVIETDPNTLAAVIYDGRDLNEALRVGDLKYRSDKTALKRFLKFFSLPAPASAA